jgi:hypothetical protein
VLHSSSFLSMATLALSIIIHTLSRSLQSVFHLCATFFSLLNCYGGPRFMGSLSCSWILNVSSSGPAITEPNMQPGWLEGIAGFHERLAVTHSRLGCYQFIISWLLQLVRHHLQLFLFPWSSKWFCRFW